MKLIKETTGYKNVMAVLYVLALVYIIVLIVLGKFTTAAVVGAMIALSATDII